MLAAVLLLHTAVYAVRPMISYHALALGAGAAELGVVAAGYAVLSLAFAIPIGRWIDRYGEIRFVVLGCAGIALVALALGGVGTLPLLVLANAALGLGHVAAMVAYQTLLANRSGPDRRDTRFGAFTVAVSLGQLLGPALGGLVAGQGGSGVYPVGAGVALAAGLLAVTLGGRDGRYAAADAPETHPVGARGLLRLPGMLPAMLTSMVVLSAVDLLIAYLPAYGAATGLSVTTVGMLLATRGVAALVSRVFLGVLVRRLGRLRLAAIATAVPAVALTAFPLTGSLLPVQFALLALAGLGLGLGQPVSLAWVAGIAPANARGTALGIRLSGNRLAQIVVPATVGAVAAAAGPGAIFWSLGLLLSSCALVAGRSARR